MHSHPLRHLVLPFVIAGFLSSHGAEPAETPPLSALEWEKDAKPFVRSVEPVWTEPGYFMCTDLLRFQGQLYCTFREGAGHVPGPADVNGRIRILRADDPAGHGWKTVALLDESGVDLRDPKLSITPDGRLMVIMGGSFYRGEERLGMHGRVSFSDAGGVNFSSPQPIVIPESIATKHDWLWRVTWHEGTAWGSLYCVPKNAPRGLHLVKSRDGIAWENVAALDVPAPSETTLRFDAAGTMFAWIRTSGKPQDAWTGTARAPYTQWELKRIGETFGGPNFIALPGGGWLAGARLDQRPPFNHTAIGTLDFERGTFTRLFALPSRGDNGDNGYPGFVVDEERGEVLVSYYSAHERKLPAIYLARLDLQALRKVIK
jgi:hypothetical protein